MPTSSRYPYWVEEMSSTYRGPTGAGVLRLALLVVLVVVVWQALAATNGGQAASVDQGSLCDQHRADPSWSAVCEEASRGR